MNHIIECFNEKNQRVLKNDIFVYDSDEPSNCEAWKRLPSFLQDFILTKHVALTKLVHHTLQGSKYKPLFTSGFRSVAVNKACGGAIDSLHLFGLAVDFILLSRSNVIVNPSEYSKIKKEYFDKTSYFQSGDFLLIPEKTHFHLAFSRN